MCCTKELFRFHWGFRCPGDGFDSIEILKCSACLTTLISADHWQPLRRLQLWADCRRHQRVHGVCKPPHHTPLRRGDWGDAEQVLEDEHCSGLYHSCLVSHSPHFGICDRSPQFTPCHSSSKELYSLFLPSPCSLDQWDRLCVAFIFPRGCSVVHCCRPPAKHHSTVYRFRCS